MLRGIEVGLAGAESDDGLSFRFHRLCLGGDRKGQRGRNGRNSLCGVHIYVPRKIFTEMFVHTICFELSKQKVVIFRTTPLPSLCSVQSEFSSPRDDLGARILQNRAASPFLQKQMFLQIGVR